MRREREAARRSGAPAGPESVARRIVHEAHELTSALDAELWASHLLGGDGARTALSAIAIVDDGELGVRAGLLAQRLDWKRRRPAGSATSAKPRSQRRP